MADLGAIGFINPDQDNLTLGRYVSGVVTDDTNAPCRRHVMAISFPGTPDNAGIPRLLAYGQSALDTGSYSLACGLADDVTVICWDDSDGTVYETIAYRVTPS